MRVTNRYLASWLHRVANAVLVGAISAPLGLAAIRWYSDNRVVLIVGTLLLYGSPVIAAAAAIVANKISVVRGVAGDAGYDGLP